MNRKQIDHKCEIQSGIAKPIWLSRQILVSALALTRRPIFEIFPNLKKLKVVPAAFQPKSALLWRTAYFTIPIKNKFKFRLFFVEKLCQKDNNEKVF